MFYKQISKQQELLREIKKIAMRWESKISLQSFLLLHIIILRQCIIKMKKKIFQKKIFRLLLLLLLDREIEC